MINNEINNADYGFTFEYLICNHYKLNVPKYAEKVIKPSINAEYSNGIEAVIPLIFERIGSYPVKFLTYSKICDSTGNLITSPHDFLLDNGNTFSIKTNKTKSSNYKVAPRVVGQAGYNVLNSYFGDIYGETIKTQQDIKNLFFYNIDKLLPVLIEKTFISDYTVYIHMGDEKNFTLVAKDKIQIVPFKHQDLTFTRPLKDWNESNSLKYKGITIAEIQTHKLRTFKFRFYINNILQFVYDYN